MRQNTQRKISTKMKYTATINMNSSTLSAIAIGTVMSAVTATRSGVPKRRNPASALASIQSANETAPRLDKEPESVFKILSF